MRGYCDCCDKGPRELRTVVAFGIETSACWECSGGEEPLLDQFTRALAAYNEVRRDLDRLREWRRCYMSRIVASQDAYAELETELRARAEDLDAIEAAMAEAEDAALCARLDAEEVRDAAS